MAVRNPSASNMIVLDRRRFLVGTGAAAGLLLAKPAVGRVLPAPRFTLDPFSLGVASGDPLPDGFVLWTRLAPDPLHGGGMDPDPVEVEWQVATDPRMAHVVRRGTAIAHPTLGHAVHVEVDSLEPDRPYWYRFRAGAEISPVGRARTMPSAGAPADRLRFAYASCQHFEQGYFSAYRHLAEDDLDLVLHLGDYIYESPAGADAVRRHDQPGEPHTIDDYRNRYALYKTDPDLQAAHAAAPWLVTWDDHETDNDWAADADQDRTPPEIFLLRRAAAFQAYYEHMPLRRAAIPRGPDLPLYRQVAFGDLARFSMLDTRQYRSDQPCGEGGPGGNRIIETCAARLDPSQTMLGPDQERWLLNGLAESTARWNVLAQPQLMAELDQRPGPDAAYSSDGWDGYPAARARILRFLMDRAPSNPIVIGGDIHSFWTTDLKADFRDPQSATLATEFVGTSITSGGIPYDGVAKLLPENPHVRFFESRLRGYVRCEVTPQAWRTDFRTVAHTRDRSAPARTLASFIVENGRPGAQALEEPHKLAETVSPQTD